MKLYKVRAESKIIEEVEVYADSYEEAIEQYYDGNYDKCEEVNRDVLETDAIEIEE